MHNLRTIQGLNYLNTSEVTNMAWMFGNCKYLTSIDVSHFNTSKVTNMSGMFSGCTGLTSLDVSNFNTAQVTDMSCMFQMCISLKGLDLCNFNTSKVRNMSRMFDNNNLLQTIYVDSGWTTSAVTNSTDMFINCTRLVGAKGTVYNSSFTDKTYAHIDGGSTNPGYLCGPKVAYACYTPSNTRLTFYYDRQHNSRLGTIYYLNSSGTGTAWNADGISANVTSVVFDPSFAEYRPTATCNWFYNMTNLRSINGFSYLNTSQVTNMSWMFANCSDLSELDLRYFNTARVVTMGTMFYNCSKLRTIYVGSGWSTAAVTYSSNMFTGCTNLMGGMGTAFDFSHVDAAYAHLDGGPSNPGYFSDMNGPKPYACYTPSDKTLTFYFDTLRDTRTGTTYDLNSSAVSPDWYSDMATRINATTVVFDPSFAYARIDGGTSNPGYFAGKFEFKRGDVNDDGSVSIGYVTALIDYLLSGDSSGVNVAAADCNNDNGVSIGDVTALIDFLLSGTWD